MRLNPEIFVVEGADGFTRTRRQHSRAKKPNARSLPGATAHVETPGKLTEQERPTGNRAMVGAGARLRGKTEAIEYQRPVGVGPSHSSDEACEGSGSGRAGGAKGRAGQGTCRRER